MEVWPVLFAILIHVHPFSWIFYRFKAWFSLCPLELRGSTPLGYFHHKWYGMKKGSIIMHYQSRWEPSKTRLKVPRLTYSRSTVHLHKREGHVHTLAKELRKIRASSLGVYSRIRTIRIAHLKKRPLRGGESFAREFRKWSSWEPLFSPILSRIYPRTYHNYSIIFLY